MTRKPRLPKEASGKDTTSVLKKKLLKLEKIEKILNWRINTEEGSENKIDDMREELEYVESQIKFIESHLSTRKWH